MHDTAPSAAAGWLLVEHPGPWPASGRPTDLPDGMIRLMARAPKVGVRVQLIRRPGHVRRQASSRDAHVFAAGSGTYGGFIPQGVELPAPWLEHRTIGDLAHLPDLVDLEALGRGERIGLGAHVEGPLMLVCAHGTRDTCCAMYGRRAAKGLARVARDRVWETTHISGHRFAPNVVSLPEGVFYGGVADSPTAYRDLVRASTDGEILLTHYRGRVGLPAPVQAAEWHVRTAGEATSIDAVRALRWSTDGSTERTSVTFGLDGDPVNVVVQPAAPAGARLTSCTKAELSDPKHYELVSMGLPVSAG